VRNSNSLSKGKGGKMYYSLQPREGKITHRKTPSTFFDGRKRSQTSAGREEGRGASEKRGATIFWERGGKVSFAFNSHRGRGREDCLGEGGNPPPNATHGRKKGRTFQIQDKEGGRRVV